jgi:hypothetical protein
MDPQQQKFLQQSLLQLYQPVDKSNGFGFM